MWRQEHRSTRHVAGSGTQQAWCTPPLLPGDGRHTDSTAVPATRWRPQVLPEAYPNQSASLSLFREGSTTYPSPASCVKGTCRENTASLGSVSATAVAQKSYEAMENRRQSQNRPHRQKQKTFRHRLVAASSRHLLSRGILILAEKANGCAYEVALSCRGQQTTRVSLSQKQRKEDSGCWPIHQIS